MTYVFNDPADFKEEVLRGFAAAHPRYVSRVPDASGFRRADGPFEGKVSLVVGGGSGHYPSYSGVVGTGFADGAVLGDIFASPSAEQVYRIARGANGGAGVVLAFGNYAGDRLNFGAAAERLIKEGIDTRIVFVTDDVASAPAEEKERRRGIAGTFTVYKMAGAAAERGDDLDTVERWMRAANEATYSFGVAFDGCTLPGATEPLFEVAAGSMDFGLGIHGEPGISSVARIGAAELARELVEKVLSERPADADGRAAVLVNGLGSTKYEELYVLYGAIAELLEAQGVRLVEPEVGELVTSLDMAGCSLTVTWLDDGLEELWLAPADTPAFRRGSTAVEKRFTERHQDTAVAADEEKATSTPESVQAAGVARRMIKALRDTVEENKEQLGRLDAVAGDGDHGIGMSRGAQAAADAAEASDGGVQTVLESAGTAFSDKAGGTSGILWGHFLGSIGRELGNTDAPDAKAVATALGNAATSLQTMSKAELGDKTMLDALFPFTEKLATEVAAGTGLAEAWTKAAGTSQTAADATADLVPKIGRARPLAERSVGTPDPGAISLALIAAAVGEVLKDKDENIGSGTNEGTS